MTKQPVVVSWSTAFIGRVVRRLRVLLTRRESVQTRAALAQFENEGGATAGRPALTPEVTSSRSDK